MLKVFKIGQGFILFFNALAILALLGAFVAPMINPEKVSIFAFAGLVMPYVLIVNVGFALYWVVRAKYFFIFSLLAIAIAWSSVKTSFPYKKDDVKEQQADFSVMSYNVRVFDRYSWTGKENTVRDMLLFIKEQDADVVCLQEFGSSATGTTEAFILNALGKYKHHYIYYSPHSKTKKHKQGLAVLSKYPLSAKGVKGDMKTGVCIYADVKIGKKTFKVINAHYESVRFTGKYDLVESMDRDNYKHRIKGAVGSFNETSVSHSRFTSKLVDLVNASEHPVILCADMNDSPVSYSYHTLSKYLDDSYLKEGLGFGGTYNGAYPFLRIDYILHSHKLSVAGYDRDRVRYSDHFPIKAEFAFPK